MERTVKAILAVLCILVIAFSSVLILHKGTGNARLGDFTDEDLYTLSEGTKSILNELNQPITLKLYYSREAAMEGPEQIRVWNNYYLYVRDLLEEYQEVSNGMVKLKEIDPKTWSDEEQEAVEYGLERVPLNQDEVFFFGLVATTELGKVKTIKFFSPDRQEFVEYDISKIISELIQREKSKIGVIADIPIMGTDMNPRMMQMLRMQGKRPEEPWMIVQDLERTYKVEKVEVDENDPAIPADIDFLMVVHPKELSKATRFAIDQFVMKGGKAMILVDPYSVVDPPPEPPPGQNPMMARMNHKPMSNLNGLLEKWGVTMKTAKDERGQPLPVFAVDRKLALKIPLQQGQTPESFYPLMQLKNGSFNKNNVITKNLKSLQILYAGKLKEVDGASTKVTPLLETSAVGSTWKPENMFELQMPPAAKIREETVDGEKPVMLACMITGAFETNFPNGFEVESGSSEASKEGEDKEAPKTKTIEARKSAEEGAAIIVMSDVDFVSDQFAYRRVIFGMSRQGDAATFVLNSLDYLAGSADLISIRSRGRAQRPFEVFEEIEQRAEKATAEEQEKIKKRIEKYQEDLQKLGSGANEENMELVQSEALAKRRKIEEDVREAKKELRKLREKQNDEIKAKQTKIKAVNLIAAPALLLLIAIGLFVYRYIRAAQHVSRRD